MTSAADIPLYMARNQENLGIVPELAATRELGEIRRTVVSVPGIAEALTGGVREAWLVTRYETVRAVLADHVRFSSDVGRYAERVSLPPGVSVTDMAALRKGNLLTMDPPEHTRLRRLLLSAFTVNRVRELAKPVARFVETHLDALERQGPGADFIAGFALPIPSLVICELLGVPYHERDGFQRRALRQLDVTLSVRERVELSQECRAYMRSLVELAQTSPGDDLIGTLVREHGDELDTDTLTTVADLLLLAGHQTTASMLGLSVFTLLHNPVQLNWLRNNLDQVESATEELLRFLSVISAGPPRVATRDVEIDGVTIRAGELVILSELAANRDPAFVRDPDYLELSRTVHSHLAFGHGAHRCLGAALARLQIRIALPALLRRFPGLALATPAENLRFRAETVAYGIAELPITW